MPVSTKGTIATGPAIVMRYSRFVNTLRSPPGKHDLVHRNGHGPVPQPRVGGILGNRGPVGIGQRDHVGAGKKRHRRNRPNIETANVVFAAHEEALERRGDQTSVPADERSLNVKADRIAPILHRDELLVLNDRPDRPDGSAQSGEFHRPASSDAPSAARFRCPGY